MMIHTGLCRKIPVTKILYFQGRITPRVTNFYMYMIFFFFANSCVLVYQILSRVTVIFTQEDFEDNQVRNSRLRLDSLDKRVFENNRTLLTY